MVQRAVRHGEFGIIQKIYGCEMFSGILTSYLIVSEEEFIFVYISINPLLPRFYRIIWAVSAREFNIVVINIT